MKMNEDTEVKEILKKVLEQHPKHKKLIRAVFKELGNADEHLVFAYTHGGYGVSDDLWLSDPGYVGSFFCKFKKDILNLLDDFLPMYKHGFKRDAIEYVIKNFMNSGYNYDIIYSLVQETLFERFYAERCEPIADEIVKRLVLYTVATWYVEAKESGFQTIEPASSIDDKNYSWHTNPKNCDDSGRSEFFKKIYPSK